MLELDSRRAAGLPNTPERGRKREERREDRCGGLNPSISGYIAEEVHSSSLPSRRGRAAEGLDAGIPGYNDPMAGRADLIESIVAQVVATVQPTRVVLFGSHARGDAREDSDVDLLVVIPDGNDRREVARTLYTLPSKELRSCPVDFIVTTESEFARRQHRIGSIYPSIVREGRELYAAA